MIAFIFKCVLFYVGIVYILIPLLCLIYSLFMAIGGLIAKAYYAIEDYFTKDPEEVQKPKKTHKSNKKHK